MLNCHENNVKNTKQALNTLKIGLTFFKQIIAYFVLFTFWGKI